MLDLPPYELEVNSYLRRKGQILEQQDTRLTLTNVDKVIEAIAQYQSVLSDYQTASDADDAIGVSSQSVPGEYSVSWDGKKNKYDNYFMQMRRYQDLVRRYLRLDRYSRYTGKVGVTISA